MSRNVDGGGIPADKLTNIAYAKIRDVHANLDIIRKVADRLSPVEDLVEFRTMIEAVHADLDALSTAAHLMLAATPAGIVILTAMDAVAQRLALGLGSVAVLDTEDLTTKAEGDSLRDAVTGLATDLAEMLVILSTKASQAALDALSTALIGMGTRVTTLENVVGAGPGGGGGLAGMILEINSKLQLINETLNAQSQTLTEINNSLIEVDGRIDSLNEVSTTLTTKTQLHDAQILAQQETSNTLSQRLTVSEEGVTSLQEDTTVLQLSVVDLIHGAQVQLEATSSLSQQVEINEAGVLLISSSLDQLQQNYQDLETGLVTQANALEELSLTTLAVEDRLTIEAEKVTSLQVAIRNSSNLVSNASFEIGHKPWIVSNRGSGWLAVEPQKNLLPEQYQPSGTNTIGLTVEGYPTGSVSLQSAPIVIEESKTYYLSGYLTGGNATVRLEYRFLNSAGGFVSGGVVGNATSGAMVLSLWPRLSSRVVAPATATVLLLQVWVSNVTGVAPFAILLRPMVEEAWADQMGPSPWVEGVNGINEVISEANAGLSARIDVIDGEIVALSEDFVELSTKVDTIDTEAIALLTTRVETAENSIEAQSENLLSLRSSVEDAVVYQTALDLEQQAQINDAKKRIKDINDDEIISVVEKPQLIIDFNAILDERPGIRAEAVLSEAVAELAAYDWAFDNLQGYLNSLVTPVRWDNTSDITYLI